jgi:hypothetical protein
VRTTESMLPQHVGGLPDVLLGIDFLLAHRFVILPREHQMLFTYNGGAVFRAPTRNAVQSAADANPGANPGPTPPAMQP